MVQWFQDFFFRFSLDVTQLKRAEEARRVSENRLIVNAQDILENLLPFNMNLAAARDLVMGLAIGYNAKELAPFVISLRQSGYTGDVLLLTHGCDVKTATFLQSYKIRIVPFTSISMMPMSMNSSRMFRYLDLMLEILLNQPDSISYRKILLCDVRDVIFQGNPFNDDNSERLTFFLESNKTLRSCPVNSDWMQRAYGIKTLNDLCDKPVSCAGTLIGSPDGIIEYLLHMVQHVVNVAPKNRFSGIDQAIHNFIMSNNLVNGSINVENEGQVMTVPSTVPTGLSLLSDGKICNPNGNISPILHQYDRDPKINEIIVEKYNRML